MMKTSHMPLLAGKLALGIEDQTGVQVAAVPITLPLLLHRLESCSVCLCVSRLRLKNSFEKYETIIKVMAHLPKILGGRQ